MPCRFFGYARSHLLSYKFCMLLTSKTNYPTYPTGEGGTRCIPSEILSSWSSNFISHSKAPKALRLELSLQSGLEVASELDMTQV